MEGRCSQRLSASKPLLRKDIGSLDKTGVRRYVKYQQLHNHQTGRKVQGQRSQQPSIRTLIAMILSKEDRSSIVVLSSISYVKRDHIKRDLYIFKRKELRQNAVSTEKGSVSTLC